MNNSGSTLIHPLKPHLNGDQPLSTELQEFSNNAHYSLVGGEIVFSATHGKHEAVVEWSIRNTLNLEWPAPGSQRAQQTYPRQ